MKVADIIQIVILTAITYFILKRIIRRKSRKPSVRLMSSLYAEISTTKSILSLHLKNLLVMKCLRIWGKL
ncbi:MAG: cellulose biosynthesis protein BcsF [Thaumarchaeota archaeon]|nr:cellulose biosynthesis protein BcsF [Nitrososphaerota archaeon]